jgi:hypothetical protein
LTLPVRRYQRLLDQHAQDWPCKIGFYRSIVDHDLAAAHFDPHPRHRILALAGCIGAALLVEFLHVLRRLRRHRRLERRQLFERLHRLGH